MKEQREGVVAAASFVVVVVDHIKEVEGRNFVPSMVAEVVAKVGIQGAP